MLKHTSLETYFPSLEDVTTNTFAINTLNLFFLPQLYTYRDRTHTAIQILRNYFEEVVVKKCGSTIFNPTSIERESMILKFDMDISMVVVMRSHMQTLGMDVALQEFYIARFQCLLSPIRAMLPYEPAPVLFIKQGKSIGLSGKEKQGIARFSKGIKNYKGVHQGVVEDFCAFLKRMDSAQIKVYGHQVGNLCAPKLEAAQKAKSMDTATVPTGT